MMLLQKLLRLSLSIILLVIVVGVSPTSSSAQTWVPPVGRGSVLLNYQYLDVRNELLFDGRPSDIGKIQSHRVLFGLDLGVTDRFAVNGAVAFVSNRYLGPVPEESIDDGSFNSSFQDASVGARYMILKDPFVLTPFASYGFPTHNYQIFGHAAVGRNLNVFAVGLGVGRDFHPLLSNGYFNATYAYSFVEGIGAFSLDTHDLYLELGYLASSSLSLRGFGNYFSTVDGVEWSSFVHQKFDIYYQLARSERFVLGGGIGYQFSYLFGSYVSIMTTVQGKNTHGGIAFNIGTRYYFSAPW